MNQHGNHHPSRQGMSAGSSRGTDRSRRDETHSGSVQGPAGTYGHQGSHGQGGHDVGDDRDQGAQYSNYGRDVSASRWGQHTNQGAGCGDQYGFNLGQGQGSSGQSGAGQHHFGGGRGMHSGQYGYDDAMGQSGGRHGDRQDDPDDRQWPDEQPRSLDNNVDNNDDRRRQERYRKLSDEFNAWRTKNRDASSGADTGSIVSLASSGTAGSRGGPPKSGDQTSS